MDIIQFTAAHLNPQIGVEGSSQSLSFYPDYSFFRIETKHTPTQNVPSLLAFEFRNNFLNGYRITHKTNTQNNLGSIGLSFFQSANPYGTEIINISDSAIMFNIAAQGINPQNNADFTTKIYVDNQINSVPKRVTIQGDVIGSGLISQPINTTFNKTLNQIANAGDININNYKLVNVASPDTGTDSANKNYVDTKTWTSIQITDFNTAVTSFNLTQFALPNSSLNLNNQKIINLAAPTISTDAANKSYVDSKFSTAGTVTSVIAGTGLNGGTITTSGTISLADISGFAPGVYYWLNSLTINSKGQVTGANSGNQPITSIVSNSGLTINTSGGQALINIFDTGVTPGTYTWPAGFSVNSLGQITFVTSSGSFPINRLSGYPSNSSLFLRGDGAWASPSPSTIDINSGTSGQLSISRLSGYPFNSNLFLRGDGNWAPPVTQFPVTVNTSDASIEIITARNSNSSAYATGFGVYNSNTNQGVQFGYNNSTNEGYMWSSSASAIKFGTNNSLRMIIDSSGNITHYDLTKFQSFNDNPCAWFYGTSLGAPFYGSMYVRPHAQYLSNIGRYTRSYARCTSFDVWNSDGNGGSAIAMNGSFIQFMQNFNNLGIIFSDSDFDTSSSYQSYISSSGSLVVASSETKKHSIRKKPLKNYLERLNKLDVYSYALSCPVEDKDEQATKDRKFYKNKQLHVGLISEQVKELFDNCVDIFKTIGIDKNNEKRFKELTANHTPAVTEEEMMALKNKEKDIYGINYNALLCYTILAVQELDKKVEMLFK